MTTIQWRPQVNALTTPQSYRPQIVPRGTSGYAKMAADIAAANPVYNADLIRSLAPLIMDWIQNELINGWQVTLKNAFTFSVSLSGRMSRPDDPLPGGEELLHVNAYAARACEQTVRRRARLERLPMNEKLPQVNAAADTKLKLADVLNPDGVLRLSGSNLCFDEEAPDCGCVIAGSWSGETRQSTFGIVANSEILLVPDIPAQAAPWQNEYSLSVTTQYTAHGTPRTRLYWRRLRTPLLVDSLAGGIGILSGGGAASPQVTVSGGSVAADERLRIQAVFDAQTDRLLLSLLDMKEGGAAGAAVAVTANGAQTLPGFGGSAVSSLGILVNDYAGLKTLVRNAYSGRLVDILDLRLT